MLEDVKSRFASVLSGSISGALVSVSIQPLDVIRTRMQGDAVAGISRGPISTGRVLYNEGRLEALWRGSGPTVIRHAVGVGLHFLFLDSMKEYLTQSNGDSESSAVQNAAIGGMVSEISTEPTGVARAISATILCPITVIKTRMEYAKCEYKSTANALVMIGRSEGIRGLYSGLAPALLTAVPFSALHYMFYRRLQSMVKGYDQPSVAKNLFCGGLSALGASVLTQPADVIRTRMQLGMAGGGVLGLFSTFQAILATQGFKGLMTGISARMTKRVLNTALIWTIYEELSPKLKAALKSRKPNTI